MKQVYISYSMEDEEFKEKLVKHLKAERIEVATSDTIPAVGRQTQKQWSERKCKSAAAVLILMSRYYQQEEECIEDAEAATKLQCPILFAKVKMFKENEWMKKIRGDSKLFDLSNPDKYKYYMKRLINSLKQMQSNLANVTTHGTARKWSL